MDDLWKNFTKGLDELQTEKETDELAGKAWHEVLKDTPDEQIRQLSHELELVREARSKNELYHLSKNSRQIATMVLIGYSCLLRGEKPELKKPPVGDEIWSVDE